MRILTVQISKPKTFYLVPCSRHCGRLLCSKCSDKDMPIIKFNLNKPVRVCSPCFEVLALGNTITWGSILKSAEIENTGHYDVVLLLSSLSILYILQSFQENDPLCIVTLSSGKDHHTMKSLKPTQSAASLQELYCLGLNNKSSPNLRVFSSSLSC